MSTNPSVPTFSSAAVGPSALRRQASLPMPARSLCCAPYGRLAAGGPGTRDEAEIAPTGAASDPSDGLFLAVSALLFAASAVGTVVWCSSMPAMRGMRMPGGWTMSMAWMRMPGQSWLAAALSFLGMWTVMMVAMMLPSLVPMLSRYRRAAGGPGAMTLGGRTALAGAGYFFVWTVLGVALYPLGVALARVEMHQPAVARAVPMTIALVVLVAGLVQWTGWKARHLAGCREAAPDPALPADAGTAWRLGLRLGMHCCYCCSSFVAILFALGVMDLRVMAVLTVAVTVERVGPAGVWVARTTGAIAVGAGLYLVARAAGLG